MAEIATQPSPSTTQDGEKNGVQCLVCPPNSSPTTTRTFAETKEGEEESDVPQCLVCFSDLRYPAVTPCGHDGVCGTCHLRLRHLHQDKQCPMCKTENNQIIVDSYEQAKPFEQYPLWGNELGSEFHYRDDVGMFFPNQHYQHEILPLFGYHCIHCDQYDGSTPDPNMYDALPNSNKNKKNKAKPTPLRGLQDHLRNKHRLTLCQLCVDFKRDFVARLPRFTPSQLKIHLTKGDGLTSGFRGHPVCEFCRPKRFYDLTLLHQHLNKEHYKCHVCDRQGLANQFFRNYAALEKHFDQKHYLCHDVQCLTARFVVFDNVIDLRAHELHMHGGTSTGSTKIQLDFRIRREGYDGSGYEQQTVPNEEDFSYGLDGQAFVPDALPPGGPDADTSHPLHLQRTAELRAQAAEIRERIHTQDNEESQATAFPSLAESNTAADGTNNNTGQQQQHLRMGWTSDGSLRRVTRKPGVATNSQQDFPSLPASNQGTNRVAAKIRAGGAGNRQFAAMRNAAMGNQTPQWGGGSTPSPSTAAFPSLSATSNTRVAPAAVPAPARAAAPAMTASEFPSLGGASTPRATHRYEAAEALARKNAQKKNAPSLSSTADFPPPSSSVTTARSSNGNSVRQKMLAKKPPTNDLNNFPLAPSQGAATVQQMKATLGPKYKQLKSLTREFASDGIAAQAYVDQAASLFDGGYGDSNFWGYLPSLLLSCPNQSSANEALRYMNQLKQSLGQEKQRQQQQQQQAASSNTWGAVAATPSVAAAPRRAAAPSSGWAAPQAVRAAPPAVNYRATTAAAVVATRNPTYGGGIKKKSAWGAAGPSTAARVKATPGSVAVAAANQGPQTGSATKFMAKQQKQQQQQQQQQQNAGNKKKKKKKQSNELRALAFK